MRPAPLVLLAIGSVLVLAGIGQVYWQMIFRDGAAGSRGALQSVRVTRGGFEARSAYPGVWMAGMGAALLIAGAWFSA